MDNLRSVVCKGSEEGDARSVDAGTSVLDLLNEGNRRFSAAVLSASGRDGARGNNSFRHSWAFSQSAPGAVPRQSPFAAVIACSDARAPLCALFDCGINELWEIRIAGNALSEDTLSSIHLALDEHRSTLRAVVVLGHTCCEAIALAVESYLCPGAFLSSDKSSLRGLINRLIGPVWMAGQLLSDLRGDSTQEPAKIREPLLDAATYLSTIYAAHEAHNLVASLGRRDVQVLYGVHDLATSQICHLQPSEGPTSYRLGLRAAPANLGELNELSKCAAERALSGALFAHVGRNSFDSSNVPHA